jgi:hypothetical protein
VEEGDEASDFDDLVLSNTAISGDFSFICCTGIAVDIVGDEVVLLLDDVCRSYSSSCSGDASSV